MFIIPIPPTSRKCWRSHHHDIEDALGSLALRKKFFRDHDRIVIHVSVHDRHQVIDGRGLFVDIRFRGDLHHNFIQLVFNRFGVEFSDCGGDWDIDIVIGILDLDAFKFLLIRYRGIRKDADDRQPYVINLICLFKTSPKPKSFCLATIPRTQTWALSSSSEARKKEPCSSFRF